MVAPAVAVADSLVAVALAAGSVVASVVGQSAVYVSGGAEHQGPAGGGPFAVVARA